MRLFGNAEVPRDKHKIPVPDSDWSFVAEKEMTLAGGTANDPGDYDGSGNPATLFTVTGTVLLRIFASCETSLAGASATIEVGVTGSTAALIAQTTATALAAGELWHDNSPDAKLELSSVLEEWILVNGADIIQTVGTANITAGKIRYFAIWYPISADGNVVAA